MARWFDITKPGKGVTKEQVSGKRGFVLFMDIYLRRFWKLILLNIIFLTASIPAIYISYEIAKNVLIAFMYFSKVDASDMTAISGAIQATPFLMLLLIQFCGAGPSTAGLCYVLKKYVDDTHAWVWSDFIKGFKDNWKQATGAYIINILFTALCLGSYVCYSFMMPQANASLRVIIVVALVIFYLMQMYTYQLMVSFSLTLKQIYKNSLILLFLKLPQNIWTGAVSFIIIYVLYNIVAAVPSVSVLVFAYVVVMVLFFSVISMSQIFMTGKTIQKYMIDNFKNLPEENEEADTDSDEDFE